MAKLDRRALVLPIRAARSAPNAAGVRRLTALAAASECAEKCRLAVVARHQNQKQPFATMAKGDNPKQAGGTPPKKWFSYKKIRGSSYSNA